MRRLLPFLGACLLVIFWTAPAANAAQALRLVDPITDNYKASYNADPSTPERRTWLSMIDVVAGGTTWRPAAPADISFEQGGVTVYGADGRTGTLALRSWSGPIKGALVRVDPTSAASGGRWGPLIETYGREQLRSTPILLDLSLTVGGSVLATGRVTYRYDTGLAGVAPGHLEYNGPGGRWYVGIWRTRTEWERSPAVRPVLWAATPPRITSVVVPRATSRRVISMRVRGRRGSVRITHLRTSVAGRRFGAWRRIAPRSFVVLPRGRATRTVRVQLRDAYGLRSRVVTRRVRCYC